MKKEIELNGRKIILLGTAHVSALSIEEVKNEIQETKPETVAIELDDIRYKNMIDNDSWKKMDIIKVFKKKQGFLMLANLMLSSGQKKMGKDTGVHPGDEMLAAINKSNELNIPTVMVDRPIATTLRRAWAKNSLIGKCKLLASMIASAFSEEKVEEAEIENLKKSSEMDSMMNELSEYLPKVKEVLIDERDKYLASKIWDNSTEGKSILAVLGAGHLPGVEAHLNKIASQEETSDVSQIDVIPPKKIGSKIATWIIPALIVALISYGFVIGGLEKGKTLLQSWVLWNGILAGIGAAIGGGHIITILVSALTAPLTSLCPFIGVGIIAGIVQAAVKKPLVQDMENLQEDSGKFKNWYKNRILRALLIFITSSLGSSLGTFISGTDIIKNLF